MGIAAHKDVQRLVKRAEAKVPALTDFRGELSMHWSSDISRTLGHVIFSPPIIVGAGQYTQDLSTRLACSPA